MTEWFGSKHNMGMAFNRSTWRALLSCAELFCSFDDYNWDWSLQYLSQTSCGGHKLRAMLIKAPRVFHIGEWYVTPHAGLEGGAGGSVGTTL